MPACPATPIPKSGEFYSPDPGHRHEQLIAATLSPPGRSASGWCWRCWWCRTGRRCWRPRCWRRSTSLSGGRLTVGIGAGWLQAEFDAVVTTPFAERGAVTDAYLDALRRLWTEEKPVIRNPYVNFDGLVFDPKPVQRPHPPIWVGGESGPSMRRAARLGDAWYPIGSNNAHLLDTLPRLEAGIARLRKLTEAAGRDPAAIGVVYRVKRHGQPAEPASDGHRRLFTGSIANVIADAQALRRIGVTGLDFDFEGRDAAQAMAEMRQFSAEVLTAAALNANQRGNAMTDIRIIAEDLGFPEGPVAMADGSVILTEINSGRRHPRQRRRHRDAASARPRAARTAWRVGPDGALYLCNNGGSRYVPGHFMGQGPAADYVTGTDRAGRPEDGRAPAALPRCATATSSRRRTTWSSTGRAASISPTSASATHTHRDHGGLYYALPDGSSVREIAYPILSANGVGLSPGRARPSMSPIPRCARLWAFDIESPGVLRKQPFPSPHGGRCIGDLAQLLPLRQPGGAGLRQHRGGDARRPAPSPVFSPAGQVRATRWRCRTATRPTSASAARTCGPPTITLSGTGKLGRCTGRSRG